MSCTRKFCAVAGLHDCIYLQTAVVDAVLMQVGQTSQYLVTEAAGDLHELQRAAGGKRLEVAL